MSDFDENEYEVDEEAFHGKEMGNLGEVIDFNEALHQCGYRMEDNIPRRDLVLIYHKTKRDMQERMNYYANTGYYDKATSLKERIGSLRADYDNRQKRLVGRSIQQQEGQFQVAQEIINNKLKLEHGDKVRQLRQYCDEKVLDHQETYIIKWANLEEKIETMQLPRIKYSKRMIELIKSEHYLNKLNQFDEARRVRIMIDKLKPTEERMFYEEYNKKIDKLRNDLAEEEAKDSKKLEESLKTIEWKDIRQRQLEKAVAKQRIENHDMDMKHSHKHETTLRPETSLYPSALWLKRKGFKETSSFLRGQQLLFVSKGRDISSGEELAGISN